MSFLQVLEHYGIPARNGMVRCPLHDDRQASMSINLEREVWKCHGCDKGGSTRQLVAEMEGITPTEADDWLTDRFGFAALPTRNHKRPGRRLWTPPWRKK